MKTMELPATVFCVFVCLFISLGSATTTHLSVNSTVYGEETVGIYYCFTNSSDIELTLDTEFGEQYVAVYFPSIQLPHNAQILTAYVQFTAKQDVEVNVTDTPVTVRVAADRSTRPTAVGAGLYNITNRWLTNAFTDWSIDVWNTQYEAGPKQRTPSLVSMFTELVSQDDWDEDKSVVVVIARAPSDKGNGTRIPLSGLDGYGPYLVIEYATIAMQQVDTTMSSFSQEDLTTHTTYLTDTEFELTLSTTAEQVVAVRFDDVYLPPNASLVRAWVQFTCSNSSFRPIHLRVALENNFDPEPFYTLAGDVSTRTHTSYLDWFPPSWDNIGDRTMAQQTPDLTPLLQRNVSSGAWVLGSSIVLLISRDPSDSYKNHSRYAYTNTLLKAPVLRVLYYGGTLASNQQAIRSTQTAEEFLDQDHAVFIDGSTLSIPYDEINAEEQIVGLLFANIPVPRYATILDARIQFRSFFASENSYVVVRVLGERTGGDSSEAFHNSTANLSSREVTYSYVDWTIAQWQNSRQTVSSERTPNLASIIQEITSQPSWNQGNSISLLFRRSPNDILNNTRVAESGLSRRGGAPFMLLQFDSTPLTTNIPDPNMVRVCGKSYSEEQESTGGVSIGSSDLEMPYDKDSLVFQRMAIRFSSIQVPPLAYVTSAYVQFESKDADSGEVIMRIAIEGNLSPGPFTNSSYNLADRGEMSNIDWSIPDWTASGLRGTDQRTPDLSNLINEMTLQQGWQQGFSIVVMFRRASTTTDAVTFTRVPHSGLYGGNPWLIVTYNTPPVMSAMSILESFAVEDASTGRITASKFGNNITLGAYESITTNTNNTLVGLRFPALNVTYNRPVLFASIQFTSAGFFDGTAVFDVCAESLASPRSSFTSAKSSDVSSRSLIACSTWTPPTWSAQGDNKPANQIWNAKYVVSSITSNPSWVPNSPIVFVVKRNSQDVFSKNRVALSNGKPVLYVAYQTSGSFSPSKSPSTSISSTPTASLSISPSPSVSPIPASATASISLSRSASPTPNRFTEANRIAKSKQVLSTPIVLTIIAIAVGVILLASAVVLRRLRVPKRTHPLGTRQTVTTLAAAMSSTSNFSNSVAPAPRYQRSKALDGYDDDDSVL
eukprot:c5105_g1_i1.p1 GENE.c5105_g1_i1~~c5105_g1_i1.p1  ORF type:complete len:1159 (+),score=300.92 c5105_g1_i1:139-3477(+)